MIGKAVLQCTDRKRKMDAGDVYRAESDSLLAPEYCHPEEEKIADLLFLKVIALSDCANILRRWKTGSLGR